MPGDVAHEWYVIMTVLPDPGLRIKLHQKDLNPALSGARTLGLSLPGTALAQELFNASKGNGWDDLDHSALVRALETMADHEVA